MAWTYSGYINEATDVARLAMARQHHAEISAEINAEIGSDGYNRSTQQLNTRLAALEKYIERLERRVGKTSRSSAVYVRNASPR